MPVQLKVQIVSVAEDGSESTEELLILTKQHERLEQLGLTLTEGKLLLREVQRRVVQQQATAFLWPPRRPVRRVARNAASRTAKRLVCAPCSERSAWTARDCGSAAVRLARPPRSVR
jgi:hypothetical protein